jgi:hypothetical protein
MRTCTCDAQLQPHDPIPGVCPDEWTRNSLWGDRLRAYQETRAREQAKKEAKT